MLATFHSVVRYSRWLCLVLWSFVKPPAQRHNHSLRPCTSRFFTCHFPFSSAALTSLTFFYPTLCLASLHYHAHLPSVRLLTNHQAFPFHFTTEVLVITLYNILHHNYRRHHRQASSLCTEQSGIRFNERTVKAYTLSPLATALQHFLILFDSEQQQRAVSRLLHYIVCRKESRRDFLSHSSISVCI